MKKIILVLLFMFLCMPQAHAATTVGKVAAVVNGDMISYFDVQQAALPQIRKENLDPKKAADQDKIRQIYNTTLDNMILEVLILDAARDNKLSATDSEVDAEITRIMQQSGLSKEGFEKQLKSEGLNANTLRTRIHNTIIRQKLMGMMVGRKIVLDPQDVQNYYDAHRHELQNNKENILALLIYPNNVDANKYAAQIKKDGKKFEEIASQISVGPNKAGGGVLGNVPFEKLGPQLSKLISALNEGEATPVIVLNKQRAQFKLVQKASKGGPMTFEEAKPVIERILREPKLKERFEEYMGQLRRKAMIDIRM